MAATDCLTTASTAVFDEKTMESCLPPKVFETFKECLVSGAPTPEEDMKVIAKAMFDWARFRGATQFGHWFFPMRFGSGAVGGAVGAYKIDAFVDLDFSAKSEIKPFEACFPYERLFFGETDGSSFPNGGLRVTHAAAAFTSWDRSSPCWVKDGILRIPCAFVTHLGKCIDDKTPLLRSMDAVNKEGLRMLKNVGLCADAKSMSSYLGWEQEFFVISAAAYKARPDLVNCGRTLVGSLPKRHQAGDLNYFAPPPNCVLNLMLAIQDCMLKIGCPCNVMHNEVAPAQHEMSPIFCSASASADYNVAFMEIAHAEATKLGLCVLFHEKPFAGINGSGKHSNWSVGTDTGVNFFYPGKSDNDRETYTVAIAALAHGLYNCNELVRCAVAQAGNDFRLGAQEAPPAIISLYPGQGFEKHVDNIIAGGALLDYKAEKAMADPMTRSSMPAVCGVEDRNRTAPFPFCGNRFEFRAVGSSQNCAFPVAVCNTLMACGMSALSDLIEGGMDKRDAVAKLYKDSRPIIFTGNGYSAEWPVEAEKRGLPNLRTTPAATATFTSDKNKAVFSKLNIYSPEEVDARQEVMYENYVTAVVTEAQTLIMMVNTGIIPACAKDMAKYIAAPKLAGKREAVYEGIVAACTKLEEMTVSMPDGLAAEANYLNDTVKPQMAELRKLVDTAEGLMEAALYPYPTYETILYGHHN